MYKNTTDLGDNFTWDGYLIFVLETSMQYTYTYMYAYIYILYILKSKYLTLKDINVFY